MTIRVAINGFGHAAADKHVSVPDLKAVFQPQLIARDSA